MEDGEQWGQSGLLLFLLAQEVNHMLSINCVFKFGTTGDLFGKVAFNFQYMLTIIILSFRH